MQPEYVIWGVLVVLTILTTLGHFAFRDLIASQKVQEVSRRKIQS